MGERLVINIKRNEQKIAAIYYHWSAYTYPALSILRELNNRVLIKSDDMTDKELQLALIRFSEHFLSGGYVESDDEKEKMREEMISRIESTIPKHDVDARQMAFSFMNDMLSNHGGVYVDDFEYAKKLFPNEIFSLEGVDRNDGLVAISQETIAGMEDWAQSIIEVDLDKKTVHNGVLYGYTIQEYLEETEDFDEEYFIPPDELERIPLDIGEFSLDDTQIAFEVVGATENCFLRFENYIYELIQ